MDSFLKLIFFVALAALARRMRVGSMGVGGRQRDCETCGAR
jgi:hypothetical protein